MPPWLRLETYIPSDEKLARSVSKYSVLYDMSCTEFKEKLKKQCRSKGNISGGARKCWRREPLGGSGGMLPQKNLKSRDLEMLFPAFSKSYL